MEWGLGPRLSWKSTWNVIESHGKPNSYDYSDYWLAYVNDAAYKEEHLQSINYLNFWTVLQKESSLKWDNV